MSTKRKYKKLASDADKLVEAIETVYGLMINEVEDDPDEPHGSMYDACIRAAAALFRAKNGVTHKTANRHIERALERKYNDDYEPPTWGGKRGTEGLAEAITEFED